MCHQAASFLTGDKEKLKQHGGAGWDGAVEAGWMVVAASCFNRSPHLVISRGLWQPTLVSSADTEVNMLEEALLT